MNAEIVIELKELTSAYETSTDFLRKLKQRIWANPDSDDHRSYTDYFEKGKEEIKNRVIKILPNFSIWNSWLKNVSGVGPGIGGTLIVKLGYKFIPVMEHCPKCSKKRFVIPEEVKKCKSCNGTGLKKSAPPRFMIEERDFPTVSALWKFCGMHVVDGKAPRLQRGVQADFSPSIRPTLFLLEDQFNFHGKEYKELYKRFREEIDNKHPEKCKAHRFQMARRKMIKIFLSHWYVVSRNLAGKEITKPYVHDILNHSDYIEPFHFEPVVK